MLQALVPIVATIAAPLAKQLITRAVGEDLAELADPVIAAVADELGVQPTAENIKAQYDAAPEMVQEAFVRAEQSNAAEWQGLITEINETMRAEHTAPGLLTRIWRPIFGLLFSFVFAALGVSFIVVILSADAPTNALAQNAGTILTWIGAGCAVLGVYVHKRSEDKRLGVG